MQKVLHQERIEQDLKVLARVSERRLLSGRTCKLSYTHMKGFISHEDDLTEVAHIPSKR